MERNYRNRRRRRRRIDPINAIGMIVVIAVILFAISTLIRGYVSNHQAEKAIADADEWYENYLRERAEYEEKLEELEQQKIMEVLGEDWD